MPLPHPQLILDLRPHVDQSFANFVVADDEQILLAELRKMGRPSGEQQLFLHGPAGSGKTHLLNATCSDTLQSGWPAMYLPGRLLRGRSWHFDDDPLEGLEYSGLLCVDDIDDLIGDAAGERCLFHLINRCREESTQLLLSARQAPAHLSIALADLRSRLGWGAQWRMAAMDDQRRCEILMQYANLTGLELDTSVANYLLNHVSRHLPDLISLFAHIDAASLAAHRRVTIPFVKMYLQDES